MGKWLTVTDTHGIERQVNFDHVVERRPAFSYEGGATVLLLCTGGRLHIRHSEEQLSKLAEQARNI